MGSPRLGAMIRFPPYVSKVDISGLAENMAYLVVNAGEITIFVLFFYFIFTM